MSTFCSYYDTEQCRSCPWIESSYPEQVSRKEQILREQLSFLSPFQLQESVTSAPQGFRNKAKMSVTGTVAHPVIGLIGESRPDEGRALLSCPIHHPRLNEILSALPAFITRFNLTPYQIAERKGELKGLIAFHSPDSNQTYLRFILRSQECVSRIRKLIPALQSQLPSLVCISANIQPIPHAILEGPEEILLTPQTFIEHPLGGITLRVSPRDFVQTNVQVAVQLYQTAAQWISEVRPKSFLELFCGNGAFSFFAAPFCGESLGIEINEEAVRSANETARRLGLKHLKFRGLNEHLDAKSSHFDLILANPPRKGLGDSLELIERMKPDHFIYSSCSIVTLAKDLKALSPAYQLRRIQLFDLFPHTEHFETLVAFERSDC